MELTRIQWRKSSRSAQSNDCVEVATDLVGVVGVRDSKDPEGAVLRFGAYSWRVFVAGPPQRR